MRKLSASLFAACVVAGLAILSAGASAQQAFKSPEEATDALIAALRSGDDKAVNRVLGRAGNEIISSGDDVQDANTRQLVLAAYDIKHSITKDAAGRAFLSVGANEYPLPIPVVEKDGAWRFDTVAGREEILYRRIGRNELAAIQASLAYVDAQNEYAEMAPTGGTGVFAQKIVSSPGKKDGLYWPAAAGEKQSPLGELVAAATARGYRTGTRAPFHGYYYKILTRQGPTAPGGAVNYIAHGKMIGGFALVAYPAQYGNSGVKTFLVNHFGDVFEKDLGPGTAKIASRMTSFNPDRTWTKVTVEDPDKK
jgi:hypothetical protein